MSKKKDDTPQQTETTEVASVPETPKAEEKKTTDGNTSSLADATEDAANEFVAHIGDDPFPFSSAIELLRRGYRVAREQMQKTGVYVEKVGAFDKLYVFRLDGAQVKYTPNDEDLFAEDWRLVNIDEYGDSEE